MTKTKALRVTLDQVLSWEPCYTKEQIVKLAGKRKSITALQILKLPIPDNDKLWAVLRKECIPEKVLHRFVCDVAWTALLSERKLGREPDMRSWDAVHAKRRWLAGKCSNADLDAASSAAWSAAWSAASNAARSAAWTAAESAAESAARSAARTATESAAWSAALNAASSAARSAAWTAARRKQVILLIKLLSR